MFKFTGSALISDVAVLRIGIQETQQHRRVIPGGKWFVLEKHIGCVCLFFDTDADTPSHNQCRESQRNNFGEMGVCGKYVGDWVDPQRVQKGQQQRKWKPRF